jgi:hypothetical protein
MLKLERKSKSRDVSVTMRERGHTVTPAFLQAFILAIAIHVLGMVLFHVSPFKIGHVATIFPPIQVKIDFIPGIDGGVLAELENEPATSLPPVPEPPKSIPQVQQMPNTELASHYFLALPKELTFIGYPFEELEKNYYFTEFFDWEQTSSPSKNGSIKLYGGLAEKGYTLQGMDLDKYLLNYEGKKETVSYKIKVENRTGKVFWYQPIAALEKRANKYFKRLLASIQFEKTFQGFITEGEIEIAL